MIYEDEITVSAHCATCDFDATRLLSQYEAVAIEGEPIRRKTANEIVATIDQFAAVCSERHYTDADEAWKILNQIAIDLRSRFLEPDPNAATES